VSVVENKRESTSLFDDYDFLIILLALFAVLVGGGLIWEYFFYKPKMERLNKVNGEYFKVQRLLTFQVSFSVDESEVDHVQVGSRQCWQRTFYLKKLSLLCSVWLLQTL